MLVGSLFCRGNAANDSVATETPWFESIRRLENLYISKMDFLLFRI